MCETTALAEFEQQHLQEFRRLATISARLKDLKAQEEELRQNLIELMEQHGVVKIDNDIITISYVAASESFAIDTKELRAKDPELYDKILKQYNKRTTRKASLRFKLK